MKKIGFFDFFSTALFDGCLSYDIYSITCGISMTTSRFIIYVFFYFEPYTFNFVVHAYICMFLVFVTIFSYFLCYQGFFLKINV